VDDGAKRWLHNTARKHAWRVVDSHYSKDDLIQDGYVCYYRVIARYTGTSKYFTTDRGNVIEVDRTNQKPLTKAHLMSLFKTSFLNDITDKAKHRTRQPETTLADLTEDPDYESFLNRLKSCRVAEDIVSQVYIRQAPAILLRVLELQHTDAGRKRLRVPYRIRKNGKRETMNERLCRLVGIDNKAVDLVAMLKQYLQPT